MWIAAKVEPNRSGPSKQDYRLYALPGQPVSPNSPIQCPVSERENGNYYVLDVGMTQGTQKTSYPYMLRKHSQVLKVVSKQVAQAHVKKN
jgi:hypothetical protein